MDRGTLFQVYGVFRHGQLVTRAESHEQAAAAVLYRCEDYCAWVPPGTILTAWNVYAGSIGGFCMRDAKRFVVRGGEAIAIGS